MGCAYAMPFALPLEDCGMVQVLMNLTNFEKTPTPVILDLVKSSADSYGAGIANAELVGLVIWAALKKVVPTAYTCET